jgi:hypothetical protein
MIDFPSSPTVGQVFGAYTWDGEKWKQTVSASTYAPLASPAFTGVPTAPTAGVGTSTTQLATTAFVSGAVTAAGSISEAPNDGQYYSRRNLSWSVSPGGLVDAPSDGTLYGRQSAAWTAVPVAPAPATVAPLMDDVAAVGTTTKYAREDHKHPTDTSREATIAVGTTAQYWRGDKVWIALDKAAVGLGSVDNTSDAAKPVSTATQTALDLKAPLASPALTGVPTVPTAAPGTNTTQAASTAYVDAAVAAVSGGGGGTLILAGGPV